MKVIHWVSSAVLAAVPLLAQAPGRVEFEVASVKPSEPFNAMSGQRVNVGVHIDGAQYRSNFLTLKDYVRIAYKVKDYQIVCPDWVQSTRFDISAKIPDGVPREKVAEMMESLLADRFGLKVHRDKKEFPVYGLIVTKGGPKMQETPPDSSTDSAAAAKKPVEVNVDAGQHGLSMDLGNGSYWGFSDGKLEVRKMTMTAVAETLSRYLDRPVIDMTDLSGNYDFKIDIGQEEFQMMQIQSAVTAGIPLPPDVVKYLDSATHDKLYAGLATLGLKLDSRKAMLDVLVVDHAEKTPTAN